MEAITFTCVLVGVLLLYLQLIMGHISRRSNHWLVWGMAMAPFYLSNTFGTIALAMMPQEQSAVVWIMYVTVLNNTMLVFDSENKLLYTWSGFNILIFCWRAMESINKAGLVGISYHASKILIASMACVCAFCKIIIVKASSSKSRSEEVASYMKVEHRQGDDEMNRAGSAPGIDGEAYNPATLMGYRYMVEWGTKTTVHAIYNPPPKKKDVDNNGNGVAIDIEGEGDHGGDDPDHKKGNVGELNRRKGLCLSFALFRLLYRRLHGLKCFEAEEASKKTLALVLEGLLPEYTRGFRVVEVELSFLHDHFHGGRVLWSRGHRVSYYVLGALKAVLLYIPGTVLYFSAAKGHRPVNDYITVITMLLLHGLFDILQFIFCYWGSNRWMVSYMCRPQNCFVDRTIASLHRWMIQLVFGDNYSYWQNRIGQYSLLGETRRRSIAVDGEITIDPIAWWFRHDAQESPAIILTSEIKSSIARVLSDSRGKLDGVPLPRWKLRSVKNSNKIQVVLKWHIATGYCEIAHRASTKDPEVKTPSHRIAKALSNYCAYLVAFRPELLPGSPWHTKATFREVRDEVMKLVGNEVTEQGRLLMLNERIHHNHENVQDRTEILRDGLSLGFNLISSIRGIENRWKILGNIWVKLILSLAPQQSDDTTHQAKVHAEYLARGGEFVTHLWAMLSHAGILEQSDWPSQTQVHDEFHSFIKDLMKNYV